MKTPNDASAIPAEMLSKLHAVVRRERLVRLQTGLARACAVLLTAMLAMMAVDWAAAPHESRWRWLMTISALACGGAALLIGCTIPFLRQRSIESVAQEVDRSHPSLQERCQTTAELAQSKDQPDIRGSEGMIRKVAQQMAAMSGTVVPGAVVSKQGLICAGKFLGAAAAVLALFFVVDFPRARVLSQRFFQPGTEITLTRVESKTGDVVIGKGENVTLEFAATGKAPDSAKLLLHPSEGRDEVVVLEKAARESTPGASKFVYTANSVTASFDYSARAGDGRTAVNHVTVLERPALADVQFQIESPPYSKLPLVSEKSLPRQVRALEGSRLEISFLPSQELASMELRFADGTTRRLEKSDDQRYHFSAVLTNTFAFEPVLTNPRHLDNQTPPNCQIIVYQDQPPTVNITSPSDDISARPDDKIEIKFQARDDFGLSRAELVVSVTGDTGSNAPPVVFPIPLDTNEVGSKFIQKSVELDLAQFDLKQDQELNYSVRVTDTKNDSSFSTPLPDAEAAEAARQAQNSALASAQNQNSQASGSQNQGQENGARNPADQNNSTNYSGSNTAQNQSGQNNGQNQSQRDMAQNQSGQNNGQNQSQPNMAQNQSGQNNGQNQSQRDMAQNQSGQNNGQNQSQPNTGQNQSGQNNGQNQSQRDMAQNQSGQNNGQNQSQPNTGQNQSGQNNGQNQSQRDMAQNQPGQNQSGQNQSGQNQSGQNQSGQNQSGQNNSQTPSTPNVARIRSPQNGGQNQSQPNMAQNQSGQNQSGQNSAQNQQQQNNGQNQSQQNQSGQNQSRQNTAQNQSRQNNGQNQEQNQNSTPPPNDMSKRNLDVAGGQTSSAQQMHIQVDEWANSFEGQMREKQELAIDPTLKQLDELLRKAHDLTETNLLAAQSAAGLGVEQTWALEESKDLVRQADRAVLDLKKESVGTAYAFIGLQVSDIGETHIAPALEELGEVTLEPSHLKEDRDDLAQASFNLDQARKMLAALTKNYEEVKRDNKLADAMQQLKKMHQIFLEDTQAMLGSKKPPVNNPIQRQIAEVDDDYAAKLNDLLQEQKKIMAELAKILADDPRMLRRFMAMQEQDTANLRDQMTLLAQRQKTLTTNTAEWTAADPSERPALAGRYLAAQTPEQEEVSTLAAKLHENMITWLPDGVEQNKEPIATALGLAAEGARLASLAASQAAPGNMTNSLDSARKALDQFRLLHDYLPDMAGDTNTDTDTDNLGIFTANRLNETSDLVTKESGWIKKMEALRDGDFSQSAQVDEHQLALDTATLNDKLDAAIPEYAAISPEIQAKSDQLLHTVQRQVLPEETRAEDALARKTLKDAVSRQEGASTAFAQAETQFDDLLKLIVAKLDSAPPPDDPGENPTLDQMLAMLQQERKAAESLGIPNRPLNIQIMTDWLRQNSSSQQAGGQQRGQRGQQPGGQRQSPSDRAQARSAQQQARDNANRANRASDQARRSAQGRAGELAHSNILAPGNTNEGGPKSPSNAWNTLASKLGDELRQSRDNVPPEQYRQAIEQYFNSISETVPASPSAPPAPPAPPAPANPSVPLP